MNKMNFVVAAFASAAAASTHAQEVSIDDTLAQIRAEIAELRSQGIDGSAWLTQERAEAIRGVVQDVLSDASTRQSLQETSATGGWKDKFFLSSPDGNYTLDIKGFTQVRWAYDSRASVNGLTNGGSEDTWGFGVRRMKITFEGTVVDPSWKYKVELSYISGDATVDDSWVEKTLATGLSLKVGQFKTPFMRESLAADTVTLMLDRSSVDGFFSSGRAQGLQLNWLSGDVQFTAAYLNAFEVKSNYMSSGTTRNLPWPSTKTSQYAFAGRMEWKPAGKWAQFKDFSSARGEEFGMLIGLAGEIEKKDNAQGVPAMYGDINPSIMAATVDLSFDFSGASLFTSGVWRSIDPETAGYATANQFGFVLQGGFFISDTVELTARYEYGDADSNPNDITPVLNTLNGNGYSIFEAVTVGANWYIAKQRVKVSTDLGYAFDGVGAFANAGNGFLADGTSSTGAFDQGGQVLARMQLQLIW